MGGERRRAALGLLRRVSQVQRRLGIFSPGTVLVFRESGLLAPGEGGSGRAFSCATRTSFADNVQEIEFHTLFPPTRSPPPYYHSRWPAQFLGNTSILTYLLLGPCERMMCLSILFDELPRKECYKFQCVRSLRHASHVWECMFQFGGTFSASHLRCWPGSSLGMALWPPARMHLGTLSPP